ncbi:Ger(x)C family spore germination protein [Salicibibacter cibarius]|uniref:Ger(X)C family spore germination protein n=1 Tax=Salicibibacter cibarius TaxID=2743000 RepID=A0A7T7CBW1_9BACI|nr:Ger(x)C family spore germination protein [Salicibibacter cibarius]QQK76280.1 Ger(x)C family spore germination protein [Salicibibacter cibarius]
MNNGIHRMSLYGAFFFVLASILTGCWDSQDIENRANVLAIAIDEADNSDEEEDNIAHLEDTPNTEMIRVTVQIAVPGEVLLGPPQGGGEQSDPVWVLSVTGHTVEEAISNLQQEVAEDIFLGQLRVIVINEDVAKKGVERFNEALRQNPQVRRNAWMVVSQEEAAQYMDLSPKLEAVPTLYLVNMVESFVDLGKFPDNYMGLFWRMVSSQGQDGYLPYLQAVGEEQIRLDGLAYFKADRMIGHIEPLQVGYFMAVTDYPIGGNEGFVPIPGTDKHITRETLLRQGKIKTEIKEGKPYARVKIRYEETVIEGDPDINLNDSQLIEKIEEEGGKIATDHVEHLIQTMQKEQSDIFGFGEYIRAKHPGYWNREIRTKDNWHEEFQNLDVDVDVMFNIRRVETSAR